jgi:hypothetical protein
MAGDEVGEALTALEAHKQSMAGTNNRVFRGEPRRLEHFHVEPDGLLFDFSTHRINETTLGLLRRGSSRRRANMARAEPQSPPIILASLIRPRRSGWL